MNAPSKTPLKNGSGEFNILNVSIMELLIFVLLWFEDRISLRSSA